MRGGGNMDRDRITELLKNYRAYKQAIINYQMYKPSPSASIANYSAMPSGSGAPEYFFDNVGKRADMGFTSALDYNDHLMYEAIVTVIDFTVQQVLSDDEAYVIRMKWLERNPMDLCKIAIVKDKDESTIRRWHRNALRKMSISMATIKYYPKIIA